MKESSYEGRVKLISYWPSFCVKYLNHIRLLHMSKNRKGDRIWEGGCRDRGALGPGVFCGWQRWTLPLAFGGSRGQEKFRSEISLKQENITKRISQKMQNHQSLKII